MYKSSIFVFILAITIISKSFAQNVCTRTVTDFGAFPAGGYLIEGSSTVIDSIGNLYVTLSNDFFTTDGPDLFLHLSVNDEAPTVAGNTNVEVAALISNSGAQLYLVPGNYSISDFNYVLIHCKDFNHFWDGGLLGSVSCTAITGLTERSENENFKVSYFESVISILFETTKEKSVNYELNIYSINGKLLLSSQEVANSKININNFFPSGFYIATATLDGNSIKRKFFVR